MLNRYSLLLLISLFVFPLANAQNYRGLYLSSTRDIVGDQYEEDRLFEYCRYANINSLTLYSLRYFDFENPQEREQLRRFIRRAKKKGGIKQFGAVSESFRGFSENIHLYNLDPLTLPDDRIGYYNIEFEFWSERSTAGYYCDKYLREGEYDCTPDGAFTFILDFIRELKNLIIDFPEIKIEYYVGWLDSEHAASLSPMVDRILYAVYRSSNSDGSVNLYHFGKQRERLESLGASGLIEIVPIFSGSGSSSDPSLYNWLQKGHTTCEAWELYYQSFLEDSELVNKENLKLTGYQWFKYNTMPNIPVNLQAPGPIMGSRLAVQGEYERYVIRENPQALYNEWWVHSRNRKSIHPAGETVLNLYFDTSGRDEIRVRSIGCGEISPWSVLEVDVQPMPDNNDHTMAFELLPDVNQGQISLTIPDSESPPFQVIIKNLYGKTLFKKSYNMPGKYILPLLREYHDSGILLVQISNSQKSLCKKISIFKPD